MTTQTPETPLKLSHRWKMASDQPISFLMQQGVENPDVISLAAGLVDPATLPVDISRAAANQMLSDNLHAQEVLQYGTTPGAEKIRSCMLQHLAQLEGCSTEELGIGSDQLIMTTGSQQLLSLVGQILLDPGDICLVAAPTYFVFLGTLAGLGAEAVPVKTDANGMCMEALDEKLEELESAGKLDRVKMIYLVSYYENPSGISLSEERRIRAVQLAKKWSKSQRIHILEDAAYRELRYDGPQLPSVWSFDDEQQHVILAQTFSKSFSPGVRVGFGVVPRDLVSPICDRKGNEDFGSANLNQHLLATVFEQGAYYPHVEMLQNSYRKKRDCMLAATNRYFSSLDGVSWVHPHGGLYVWMTLPDDIETGFQSQLFHQATEGEGVMYVPGELCQAGDVQTIPRNQMRLSFGAQSLEGIEQGIQRLAKAVAAILTSQ